ncbi:hypothetical protein [Staphylococcus sp. LCT-H4]|uniref:hypothetical protein n=1 Tax=Staphylococcus sp. LCT-H4 TaxID=1914308 RepID=UPI0008F4EF93|nr:hypothetical protein [Staphylococcus sp. LCT-H4]OIJ29072.1 hypothetical protein BK821_12080 [Staphylococcus sp. LCT-H4]
MKNNFSQHIRVNKLDFNSIYKNIEDINSEFRKQIFESMEVLAESMPSLVELKEALESFTDNVAKINSIFIRYDYPPIDYIDIHEVMNYIEMNSNQQQITKENINLIMTRYFDEIHFNHLESQVATYNLPQEEITILKEILDGYKHGYYYLIIPALLARLEGLIFNSVNYKGRTSYYLFNIVIEETINKYKSNHDYYVDDDYDKIKEYYKYKLKSNFEFGDGNMNGINRNSIMHGYDNKYGTKQNAVMLLLHFEYLYHCLTKLSENEKKDICNKMQNKK